MVEGIIPGMYMQKWLVVEFSYYILFPVFPYIL